MRIYDSAKASSRKKHKDGYLIADAVLSRTGIQDYSPTELVRGGVEVPPHLMGNSVVRLDRPEKEVFAPKAMSSLAHVPLTIGHPEDDVSPDNVKDLQVGFTMGPVTRKSNNAVAPVMVQAQEALDAVDRGTDQLSVGYDVDIVFLPESEAKTKGFDGFMTNIIPNHVALVDQARGGENVRIMDEGDTRMDKRLIDGVSYEFPPQSAQAVDKLQSTLADAKKTHTDEMKKLRDEKVALEAKLDVTEKALKTEKEAKLSDEDIAKLVDEKGVLVEQAKQFLEDSAHEGLATKSNTEIKKAVVSAVYDGMDAKKLEDEVYVQAAYDTVILNAKPESDAQKVADGIVSSKTKDGKSASATARDAMIARRSGRKEK